MDKPVMTLRSTNLGTRSTAANELLDEFPNKYFPKRDSNIPVIITLNEPTSEESIEQNIRKTIYAIKHEKEYRQFVRRHPLDKKFREKKYDLLTLKVKETIPQKYPTCDQDDILDIHPSYSKFVIPLEIISRKRYLDNVVKYEKQFRKEIRNLIDFQSTALEASYFVRIISYTTFWPPLHNRHELEHTSNNFFKMSPKEKQRLDFIMSHEFT